MGAQRAAAGPANPATRGGEGNTAGPANPATRGREENTAGGSCQPGSQQAGGQGRPVKYRTCEGRVGQMGKRN